MSWEDIFQRWASGPSQTEQDKCENAERAVRNAIAASDKLNRRNIKVFAHGSYRNHTNVREDSDVDVGILCYDTFFMDLPNGYTRENFGISPATYHYEQFKDEVSEALSAYFGKSSVLRGNKAFDIHENSYRVDADVAPFFEHRRYSTDRSYLAGVELQPDNGGRIINWPDQTYLNGVRKNDSTSRRYKRIIRILKLLRNTMQGDKITGANGVASFLIECLVWNAPNKGFNHSAYMDDIRYVLAHIFNETISDEPCKEWGEVNELKYLFRLGQPWSRIQAHEFAEASWDYIGFK